MSIEINLTEDVEPSCTVVLGFPSIGYAGIVAANYLLTEHKMKLIGTIASDIFPPAASIHDYVPSPPVRIYKKDRVVVIVSDILPSDDKIWDFGISIVEWIDKCKCEVLIILDGIMPRDIQKINEKKIFSIGTTEELREILKKNGVEQIKDGLITGISGVALGEGVRRHKNILCLLCEANPMYPDARAAVNILEIAGKLYPVLKTDLTSLRENANEIESKIKGTLAQAVQLVEARKKQRETIPMYR